MGADKAVASAFALCAEAGEESPSTTGQRRWVIPRRREPMESAKKPDRPDVVYSIGVRV